MRLLSAASLLIATAPAAQTFTGPIYVAKQTASVFFNNKKQTTATTNSQKDTSRHDFLGNIATTSFSLAGGKVPPKQAASAAIAKVGEKDAEVYFGAGCFWRIQHELSTAERDLLSRSASRWSSRAGYAGGTRTDKQGRLCYPNANVIADYATLGHAQVVETKIPEDTIGDFAKYFFRLLGPNGDRADLMDLGGEYRSLIGLLGGQTHPMYPTVLQAAADANLTLKAGKGDEPDTLGKRLVYIYDSNKFPFHQAEIYHQYHNDFQEEPYGKKYNDLATAAFKDGRLKVTGCPDRVLTNVRRIGVWMLLLATTMMVALLLRGQIKKRNHKYTYELTRNRSDDDVSADS